jgi:signal transduction histidine kinase
VIAVAAIAGWGAATLATLAALLVRRRLAVRMELGARVSHEVRNPLAAARLGLELGARGGDLSPARLRAIDLELGRAAVVLEDLTPARPVRAGLRRREPVDVGQLLVDSVEAWRASAVARGVGLELEWRGGPVSLEGDRWRLAQATGNLIANAIEHGGGAVVVRGQAQDGSVRIEVLDGGPGLPAPVAEMARRRRGWSRRRGRRGGRAGRRGHGLAIATEVIRAHGGRLAAAPSRHGARILVELPVSAAESVQTPEASSS